MSLAHKPCEILIAAILLHDVLEDTPLSYEDLKNLNPDIADIVE
jgi:(p)ppGpp synthase/HD superfamily hydrolase